MKAGYDTEGGRSVGRFLGMAMREETEPDGPVRVCADVRASAAVLDADGRLHAGALFTMVDCIGGFCGGLGALPDGWVVTTNLMVRSASPVVAGPVSFETEVLRRGRSAVVTSVRATDADGQFVVAGTVTSAVLVPEGGVPQWERPARLELVEEPDIAFDEFVATEPTPDGVILELADDLRNPWGFMHGGVTSAIVDAAARRLAQATTTTDLVLHYLAPARIGPVRASGRVVGRRPDGADRKSTRLNSSHVSESRMPSSA